MKMKPWWWRSGRVVAGLLAGMLSLNAVSEMWADGPQDNLPANVRAIPPEGIEVPAQDRKDLQEQLERLQQQIAELKRSDQLRVQQLLPDVEIYHRGVLQALELNEFYSPREIENAKKQLAEGSKRAEQLRQGEAPWTTQTGFVVRGYRSRIDDTVQPYGLEIPAEYAANGEDVWRVDLWLHGRNEKITETAFLQQRTNQKSKYNPERTIVLHPYGRYSNAFKFAGEVDVLEALEHAKTQYRVDPDRIAVRGFSMGGAGCWQMAAHYPDQFFAANPGAGFSETQRFLKVFQNQQLEPTWFEQTLWQWYDTPVYAENFFQLPLIAYSGEIDKQKQAADVMAEAFEAVGLPMQHVIGPQTAHQVHPDSAKLIDAQLTEWAKAGRPACPTELRFATPTLKYNSLYWLQLQGLQEHWVPARVHARLLPEQGQIVLQLENVSQLQLQFAAEHLPFRAGRPVIVTLQNFEQGAQSQTLTLPALTAGQSWSQELRLQEGRWQSGALSTSGLRKRPGLQGPIDDAFMDRFVVVRPTGTAWNERSGEWAAAECERFLREWRRHFRGDARVVNDRDVTPEILADSHVIVFGDPGSNAYLQSLLKRLPLRWTKETLEVANQGYAAATHAPVLIYPHPDQPERYLVLNSGFTYREFAYLNNARQVPMLPDWGVINLESPPNAVWPGKVVAADFFDERWQVRPARADKK